MNTFMTMALAVALGSIIGTIVMTAITLFIMTRKSVMKAYFKWVVNMGEELAEIELEEDDKLHLV